MDFQPCNSDHAIQSATFTLTFATFLPAAGVNVLRSRADIVAELPAIQAPQGVALNLAPASTLGGVPLQRRIPGVQLSHLRPDGTPAWALRMMGPELAVECNRYTRWDRVWDTASRYIGAGLEAARSIEKAPRVAVIAHNIVDLFIAGSEKYDLSTLMKKSDLVASNIFSSGSNWHNHLGWFMPKAEENYGWLNQLNIDGIKLPSGQYAVQFSHNQELRFTNAIEITEAEGLLTHRMNALHLNNKKVLSELLTEQMIIKIGLTQ